MNWRRLPPLHALRAFAALAEHGSLSAAGTALNVSHAAIGQQVRALETHLGLRLVEKSGRGLALTPAGARLADTLTGAFAAIGREVEEITGADADRPLQVSTTPTFAANWLLPRIADFHGRHPEIDVMLNPTPQLVALEPGGIDIAIRFGRGGWPGLDSAQLMATDLAIVASRSLIGDRDISTPVELLDYPWLQELGTTEVTDWLKRMGVTEGRVRTMTHVPGNLVLDGVRRGTGISATTRAFIEDDIAAGRLRVLFEEPQPGSGYHIVTRPGVLRPSAKAFAAWLRRQAAA